jgi:imidazolonepropionase
VGYRADLAIHDVEDYRELPYWFGERLCAGSWMDGRACHVTP